MGEFIFALLLAGFMVALPWVLLALAGIALALAFLALVAVAWVLWKALKVAVRMAYRLLCVGFRRVQSAR